MALLSEAPSLSIQLLCPGFKNSLREKLYQFCGNGAFSSPSTCGSLALSGPPNWPSPTPPPTIIAAIKTILDGHNPLEEGPGGVYEECERLLGTGADEIVLRLQSAPRVAMAPHVDNFTALESARNALRRAGYDVTV